VYGAVVAERRRALAVGSIALPAYALVSLVDVSLPAAEDALAALLRAELPRLLDFQRADPRFFSHAERLSVLKNRLMQTAQHDAASPHLADQLVEMCVMCVM
jgi:hypothetical protein